MSEFLYIIGGVSLYQTLNFIEKHYNLTKNKCGPCEQKKQSVNASLFYGPTGSKIDENYLRDDFAKDMTRFPNSWTPETLFKEFGVLLGDTEALYGKFTTRSSDKSTAQILSPFQMQNPGMLPVIGPKFNEF